MNSNDVFKSAFLAVGAWIALSVAHLPAIEQRLDDYINATDKRLVQLESLINNSN